MKRIYFVCLLLCLTTMAARLTQAQKESILFNFCTPSNCNSGSLPNSILTPDGKGNFYGTTSTGGVNHFGTVFKISSTGKETVLHSFTQGNDGGSPGSSSVIFDSKGNLYGTTTQGGSYGFGVAFELSPVGSTWKEKVLYTFCSVNTPVICADGNGPVNGLIMRSGKLYGLLTYGSNSQDLAVFELSPSGDKWKEKLIYNSTEFTIPSFNSGIVMDKDGDIFGLTFQQTVFELSPKSNGDWDESTIYTFTGSGINPEGTLAVDADGNLYGATEGGGTKSVGTVFKLTHGKTGWTEKVLYSFGVHKDDAVGPLTGVTFDSKGNIYGTTYGGGSGFDGTVYELVKNGSTYKEKVLWDFNGTDGAFPRATPIVYDDDLYGTTPYGGPLQLGDVYKVTP